MPGLKRMLIITGMAILLSACAGRGLPTIGKKEAAELQQTLDQSLQKGGLIGVSAAMIDANGTVWTGVSGYSQPGTPITDEMLFDMGSAGKTLAAALMLDLTEDGLISLDDPIEKYIDPPPGVDGTIPIRMLLNHTSGLANMVEHPDSPFRTKYRQIEFERWWEIDEIFTELSAEPYFEPGESWHYSQAGYQIATLIAEEVTGKSTPELIQSRLLDPQGIDSMLLDFSQPVPDQMVIAHNWVDLHGNGIPTDVSGYSKNWIASLSRILTYTTAEGWARWGHALFTGQVLEDDSLGEMLDFVRIEDFGSEPPIFSGYGLGVLEWIPEMLNGHYGYGHSGSIPGYRAFLAYLPDSDLTIAVLSNSDKEQELGNLIIALLDVVLESEDELDIELETHARNSLPEGQAAVSAFSDEMLFCERQTVWEISASEDQWIDLSVHWVVAADQELVDEIWPLHSHQVEINDLALAIPDESVVPGELLRIDCGGSSLELWAKGYSLYLTPLPAGEYLITWHSDVNQTFDNGFAEYKNGDYLEAAARLTVTQGMVTSSR